MANAFDPYHKWLGIPPREQPADHYRLLGVERFEDDADVISLAADQRMQFLRSFQNGERAKLSQQLLNEVAKAKVCLLDPDKKTAYDKELRQTLNEEKGAASHSAETPNEDLAATLEFAAPETSPDWPPEIEDQSESSSLWSPKSESSAMTPISPPTPLTRKVKIRTLVVSILAFIAGILSLVILINAVLVEPKAIARKEIILQDKQEATPQLSAEVERKAKAISKLAEANRKAEEEAKRKAKEEVERRDREEAERKAKEEAERKAAEEAERKAKEEAERQARVKAQYERMRLTINLLKQGVAQSVTKADRLKDNPQQARQVIRESLDAVQRASVPDQIKQSQKRILQRMAMKIEKIAAAQRAQKEKEEEELWRREHPAEYLESVGLAREKNGWEFEAALELNEIKEPLAKLINEYKKKSSGLKTKGKRITQQENKMVTDMGKLPGAFQNQDFRYWVLSGRQRAGNEPNRKRRLLDDWSRQYDFFREKAPQLALRLEGKINDLQSRKNQLREELAGLQLITRELSNIDRQAEKLLYELEQRENQLEKEKPYIEPARESTGLKILETDTTNTQNLLKKTAEILEDDLIHSLPTRR